MESHGRSPAAEQFHLHKRYYVIHPGVFETRMFAQYVIRQYANQSP